MLRDGEMQARSVAMEGGVVSRGPLPEVDLRGYLVLPGIVDLAAGPLRRGRSGVESAVRGLDSAAASFGITTVWSAQGWSWAGGACDPRVAEAVAQAVASHRSRSGTDLRLQILCDIHMMDTRGRLLAAAREHQIDQVIFADRLSGLLARSELRREELCRQAALRGMSPEAHLEGLRSLFKRHRETPRFLCHLAEVFDGLGVIYGSLADADGETREMYSMIGARLCLKPQVRAAAALARAVGDPVVLSARDVVGGPGAEPGFRPLDAIQAGLCTALCSDGGFEALVPAVFTAAEQGGLGLAAAWALISRNPAEIMRLPDRGDLEYGRRADLVVINAASRRVEATLSAGRLTYLTGEAANRFRGAPAALEHAAQ